LLPFPKFTYTSTSFPVLIDEPTSISSSTGLPMETSFVVLDIKRTRPLERSSRLVTCAGRQVELLQIKINENLRVKDGIDMIRNTSWSTKESKCTKVKRR